MVLFPFWFDEGQKMNSKINYNFLANIILEVFSSIVIFFLSFILINSCLCLGHNIFGQRKWRIGKEEPKVS